MTDPTPRTTAAVLALVAGIGDDKHADTWRDRSDQVDMSHFEVHKVHYFSEDYPDYDAETGVLHLIHACARLKFVIERRLIRDEVRAAESNGSDGD